MELEAPHSSLVWLAPAAKGGTAMRHSLVGALIVAGLVVAATAGKTASQSAPGAVVDSQSRVQSNELITHVTSAGGQQVVTVIDSKQRVMAVYHVDGTTGQITPKSVRNISWDLQMIEYNSGNPLPQDIRSGLQR
jgi:outer membrane PBP1 activator LpoA protein